MTTNKKRYFAPVDVSDEVRAFVGTQVGVLITHLRTSGADCWHRSNAIRRSHRANLVLELTADGMRSGFVHAACGPSQLQDLRANRRAAFRAQRRMAEITSDVQAFLGFRSSPGPRAVLVVSPVS